MKKNIKMISMLIIATLIIFMACSTISRAFNPGDIISNVGTAANNAAEQVGEASQGFTAKAGNVVALIRNIAVIASVILISFLGIKYMLGSVEEKAEYKKSFIPLIVGAIVVVAATSRASLIFSI